VIDPVMRGADPSRSGQAFAGRSGAPSAAAGLVEIRAWATNTQGAIEHWREILQSDLDDPLKLEQINDLKDVIKPLRSRLTEYLFGDDARLRAANPGAWEGIKRHWYDISRTLKNLQESVRDYRDWLVLLAEMRDQISLPLAMKQMAGEMRRDSDEIVSQYHSFAGYLIPAIEEVINLT
jgi:hypothetical protein